MSIFVFMNFSKLVNWFRPPKKKYPFQGKIFCIGANKTGTTSLKKAFCDLGFPVGNQQEAELMLRDYIRKDFSGLIAYCQTAQVFQDVPFNWPEVYKTLDQHFPGSKFILSVRDSPEVWFQSLVTFHSRIFGDGKVPTGQDLRNADYIWKGWIWEFISSKGLKDPENNPYDPEERMYFYSKHNEDVRAYFKDRPQDLLDINLNDPDAWKRFCQFINVHHQTGGFPWANKTEDIPIGGWKNSV
jgi:hypothetical protein